MPAPKTANGYSVEMRFTSDGEAVENIFHIIDENEIPLPDPLPLLANMFASWWQGHLRPRFCNTIALREVYAVDLTLADGPTYSYPLATPMQGTATGAALPNNCALVATKRTAKRGRAYRGRTYFCGIPEEVVTVSVATPSYVTDLNLACAGLAPILAEESFRLGVLSKRLDGAWRAVGVITPVVTYGLRDGVIDSQRERLPQ